MSFQPFTIPLTGGLRQDVDPTSASNPSMLDVMNNCIITHKGSIRGRPGLVSENTPSQTTTEPFGSPAQDNANMHQLVVANGPNGLAGLETTDSQILALYQGTAYARSSKPFDANNSVNNWRGVGPFWSFKKEVSPFLDSNTIVGTSFTGPAFVAPVHTGANLVSIPITSNKASGLPLVDGSTITLLDSTSLTNFDSVSQSMCSIANNGTVDMIVYPKVDGSLWMHTVDSSVIPNFLGSSTEVNLLGAGSVSTSSLQRTWLVNGASAGEFYVASVSSTAGNVRILRLTAAGSTATLTLTGLGTLLSGVCLSHNGAVIGNSAKLVLGYVDSTTNTYKTKIINITNTSTMTDAGINTNFNSSSALQVAMNHTVGYIDTPAFGGLGRYVVNFIQNNIQPKPDACMIFMNADNSTSPSLIYFLPVGSSVTSSSLTGTGSTFIGWATGYYPFLPAKRFGAIAGTSYSGSITIGVLRVQDLRALPNLTSTTTIQTAQWFILDINSAVNNAVLNNGGTATVMAAGQSDLNAVSPATNSYVNSSTGTYKFGIQEITSYTNSLFTLSAFGGTGINNNLSSSCVITLTECPSNAAQLNNTLYLSGCAPMMFDGNDILPVSFYEGAPCMFLNSIVAGSGVASSGSYTLQAVWELTTSNGKRIRSKASIPLTVSVTSVNSVINISVTNPLFVSHNLTTGKSLKIKVYSTQATAGANAPLNLVAIASTSTTKGIIVNGPTFITLFPNTGPAVTVFANEEILYTVGNVYDDGPPPSADRGVALVNNRIYAADYKTVYASKLFSPVTSVAWNTSGALAIPITGIGEIIGLGSIIDKLVVVGTSGVANVYGAGVDDTGNGPGWTVEILPNTRFINKPNSNNSSYTTVTGPRCVTNVPNLGVAYLGMDGEVWLVDTSGTSRCLGRPTKDTPTNINDIVYCEAHKSSTAGGDPLGRPEHGPLLVVNGSSLKVLDIELGLWGTWSLSGADTLEGAMLCSLYGTLYTQMYTTVSPIAAYSILSFSDWTSGTDFDTINGTGTVPFPMRLVTSSCSIAGPQDNSPSLIWGRLRSISPLMTMYNSANLTVKVYPDGTQVANNITLLNKTLAITQAQGPSQTWPYLVAPEFRTTTQRCGRFRVDMSFDKAVAEVANIDFWSWAGNDRAPARTRM